MHGGVAGLVADLLLGEGLRLVCAPELEQRVRVQLAVDDVAAPPDDARLKFLQLRGGGPRVRCRRVGRANSLVWFLCWGSCGLALGKSSVDLGAETDSNSALNTLACPCHTAYSV